MIGRSTVISGNTELSLPMDFDNIDVPMLVVQLVVAVKKIRGM